MDKSYSIIIPAYNEAEGIKAVLEDLLALPHQERFEIIVVDDCSKDETAAIAAKCPVVLLKNAQNFGYGYSLKRGITEANHSNIVILDADGSYPVEAVPGLIGVFEKGFDMVVGARQGMYYHGSLMKRLARFCFRVLSEFSAGRRIPDINSGLRIFRKDIALRFFHTIANGFSFTTTITLAFMLNFHTVIYIPVEYRKRKGHSKVRYLHDTLRSLQIIIEAIATYNPLKIFLLIAVIVFVFGISMSVLALWYAWIALLLFLTVVLSVIVFSLGLIPVVFKNRTGRE